MYLIIIPLVTKLLLAAVGLYVFKSLFDLYDLVAYYDAAQNVIHGSLPWTNEVIFYYPPLALIPMLIASIGGTQILFDYCMFALMIVCDIVTTFCVYYIGLRLYPQKTAFLAAVLSATAISAGTFILTRFDAFPTCLVMLAILFTVYGDKTKGYLFSIAGLFVKIWPVILFPFLWIYNSGERTIFAEGKERALMFLLTGIVLFGLMIAAGYDKFLVYTGMAYCNTISHLIYYYLYHIGLKVPYDIISGIITLLLGAIILGSLYGFYNNPKTVRSLLRAILIVLVAVIFLSQYRSPQYIVWFTPIAALLVADDIRGVVIFFGVQVLGLIEFPLAYRTLYVNEQYLSSWAPLFFTLFFVMIGLLVWQAVKTKNTDDDATTG